MGWCGLGGTVCWLVCFGVVGVGGGGVCLWGGGGVGVNLWLWVVVLVEVFVFCGWCVVYVGGSGWGVVLLCCGLVFVDFCGGVVWFGSLVGGWLWGGSGGGIILINGVTDCRYVF
uniref:NADH dehydrogenase subunit 6 n=1 Tax=Knipowitschia caucasica TaxID=637954 RepID=A0AAV2JV98_KNICA